MSFCAVALVTSGTTSVWRDSFVTTMFRAAERIILLERSWAKSGFGSGVMSCMGSVDRDGDLVELGVGNQRLNTVGPVGSGVVNHQHDGVASAKHRVFNFDAAAS